MNSKNQSRTKGFTLVEVIIFMAVASIFIVLIFSVLNSFIKSRSTAKKLGTLQQTATYVFNELTQEIHWSDRIEPADLPNTLTLIQIQPDDTEIEVTFSLLDGQLRKETGPSSPEPISPPEVIVSRFEVFNRASGEIPCLEIKLYLEYAQSEPTVLAESQTTISLRKTKFKTSEE